MAARWKKCRTLPLSFAISAGAGARFGLGGVAGDRPHAFGFRSPAAAKLIEFLHRSLAHEDEDGAFALDQLVDEKTADEAGRAGDEISHGIASRKRLALLGRMIHSPPRISGFVSASKRIV